MDEKNYLIHAKECFGEKNHHIAVNRIRDFEKYLKKQKRSLKNARIKDVHNYTRQLDYDIDERRNPIDNNGEKKI